MSNRPRARRQADWTDVKYVAVRGESMDFILADEQVLHAELRDELEYDQAAEDLPRYFASNSGRFRKERQA